MKKGIIINFKRFKLLNYVNFNKVLLGLCFVFLLGVFIKNHNLGENQYLLHCGFAAKIFRTISTGNFSLRS